MPRVPSPTQCVCPRVSHTVCPSHMFGQMGPGLGGKMHNLTENIKKGGNLRTETRIEAPQSENTKTQKIRIWFWLCNLAHQILSIMKSIIFQISRMRCRVWTLISSLSRWSWTGHLTLACCGWRSEHLCPTDFASLDLVVRLNVVNVPEKM